jgi:hypothetical protein
MRIAPQCGEDPRDALDVSGKHRLSMGRAKTPKENIKGRRQK